MILLSKHINYRHRNSLDKFKWSLLNKIFTDLERNQMLIKLHLIFIPTNLPTLITDNKTQYERIQTTVDTKHRDQKIYRTDQKIQSTEIRSEEFRHMIQKSADPEQSHQERQ